MSAALQLSLLERARLSTSNGTHATLDFETRSKLDVSEVGAYRYAMDPSTSITTLRYRFPGDPILYYWNPWHSSMPEDLLEWVAAGGIVEAHNAEFEFAIWNYVAVPRLDWPRLVITQVRCSAAKAAALALPRSLEKLGLALKLPVQKDMEGNRVMRRTAAPRRKIIPESSPIEADEDRFWHESFEEIERVGDYCGIDVVAEELASEKMIPLIPRAEKTFQLTQRMNERGIYCDTELCKIAVRFATLYRNELNEELHKITDGKIERATQGKRIQNFLDNDGLMVFDLQAQTVAELLERKDLTPLSRRVLEIRQALALSSITKYQKMLDCAGPDKRIRGTLLFHGASTGRYSGRLIQPQNYVKPKIKDVKQIFEVLKQDDYEFFRFIYPDVLTALASVLRGMLCAAPGNVLFSGDFNAIEARVIIWLAGDDENLDVYLAGDDPYKHMAALIYGVTYDQVTKEQRELGKRAVLGCGFGMGAEKFFETCRTQGFPISMELAERAVKAYREKYGKVKSFWYALERAAIQAVKAPGSVSKIGRLQWLYRGGYLLCRLPSGRCIAYAEPQAVPTTYTFEKKEIVIVDGKEVTKIVKEKRTKDQLRFMAVSKNNNWSPERTYGGKLAENVTQAVAADVMIESMFRAEGAGYNMIFSVHDELVAETPEGFGSVEEFENIMAKAPAWADRLPIKVEGWRDFRYKK